MRAGQRAIAWGRSQVDQPDQDYTRLCLQFVRKAFGLQAVHPDAGTAWDRAKLRHRTSDPASIPAGVPVFWETPSTADHVALAIGGGLCLSTDAKRRGRVDVVAIASIGPAWGATLLGWTEDLNGTVVWRKALEQNRVSVARDELRQARRLVRIAASRLEDAPKDREVVHDVAQRLDGTIASITHKLERLPKR